MRNEFSNAIDEREGSIAKKIAGRLLAGVISASLILPMSGGTDKVREEPPSAVVEATPTQAPFYCLCYSRQHTVCS